jgi:hypothetical protein
MREALEEAIEVLRGLPEKEQAAAVRAILALASHLDEEAAIDL